MLFRMVGSSPDFDDLQQTVFLRLLVGLKSFREEAAFSTWIGAICVNVVRDHLRSGKTRLVRHATADGEPLLEQRADPRSPHAQLEAREGLRLCRGVLSRLSENHRLVFVLRVMGYSIDEIAAMTGAAVSTTRLRLYWARKAFARHIGQEVEGELPVTAKNAGGAA